MSTRLYFLFGIVVFVGFVTRAFAETIPPTQNLNAVITRVSALALLESAIPNNQVRLQQTARLLPPLPLFTDTDQNQWYSPYIELAFMDGIIHGNSDGTFHPGDVLTVSQALTLATNYRQLNGPSDEVVLTVPGYKAPAGGLSATLITAGSYGIKTPEGKSLADPITRGEFFIMLSTAGIPNPGATVVQIPERRKIMVVNAMPHTMMPATQPAPVVNQAQAPAPTQPATTGYKPGNAPAYAPPTVRQPTVNYRPPTPAPTVTYHPLVPVVQQPRPVIVAQVTQPAVTQDFSITMPTLGITGLHITHPSDLSAKGVLTVLQNGVGHLFSYPGQGGTILIYGHSSSYRWDVSKYTKIFRQINKLSVGDMVYVNYGGKQYTYRVTVKQTVPAGDMSAFGQTGSEELILYTCWPPDSISQRYLVRASPVDAVARK